MKRTIIKREKTVMAMPAPLRVASYARVSSGKEEMLHSLAAQVSYYSEHIQGHPGWVYAGVYADEAVTGTKESRPEFLRLIEDCRGGKIDLVLTKSISRFARNTVDLLVAVRELKSLGVDIFFEEQKIHTLSGEGELMLTILASYAQEESRSVSENCKWRIRKQFQSGELANLRFMFGYKIVKGKVEIEPEQAAIVRMIFEDYLGGLGGGRIAAKLKEMNIATVLGGDWDAERVIHIISNEKYTGNALLQKRYVTDHLTKKRVKNKGMLPKYFAEGTHPPIIDAVTFEKAQAVLAERRKLYAAKSKEPGRYPFTGIIRCQNCGKNYKRRIARGRAYWQCSTYLKQGKAACYAKQIPEPMLCAASIKALGLDEFDEGLFKARVSKIQVPAFNKLVFVFNDGRLMEEVWRDRSRSESWTDEMRRAARERAKRRCAAWQ